MADRCGERFMPDPGTGLFHRCERPVGHVGDHALVADPEQTQVRRMRRGWLVIRLHPRRGDTVLLPGFGMMEGDFRERVARSTPTHFKVEMGALSGWYRKVDFIQDGDRWRFRADHESASEYVTDPLTPDPHTEQARSQGGDER